MPGDFSWKRHHIHVTLLKLNAKVLRTLHKMAMDYGITIDVVTVVTIRNVTRDDKVGIMMTLTFQWDFWSIVTSQENHGTVSRWLSLFSEITEALWHHKRTTGLYHDDSHFSVRLLKHCDITREPRDCIMMTLTFQWDYWSIVTSQENHGTVVCINGYHIWASHAAMFHKCPDKCCLIKIADILQTANLNVISS